MLTKEGIYISMEGLIAPGDFDQVVNRSYSAGRGFGLADIAQCIELA